MSNEEEEIVLRVDDPQPCARCKGPSLLQVQFPHSWKNNRGEDVTGIRETVLCPRCDQGEPAAGQLIARLQSQGTVSLHDTKFQELVAAWVDAVRQRTVDEEQLTEEHQRWSSREL